MTTIGIVDHGMGNRRSVEKALERVGARVALTADHDALRAADGLVVPGVGAFAAAMRAMRELGLDELVVERAGEGTPVLGLCLGMQLLFDASTELGGDRGLGLLPGRVVALDAPAAEDPAHRLERGRLHARRRRCSRASASTRPSTTCTPSWRCPTRRATCSAAATTAARSPRSSGAATSTACSSTPRSPRPPGCALLANFTSVCARVAA